MQTILSDLQSWYAAQCDGDWEHSFGVKISTIDNPGWSVKINLDGTLLEDKVFASIERQESDQSWLSCKIEKKWFIGYGGPDQLEELLVIFLDWAKSEPDWLAVQYETEEQSQTRRERELWAALGEETGAKLCSSDGCERKRIRYSAFCRAHHFERMTGKTSPTEG